MMNIYLISQSVNTDWETYLAAVVAAVNENEARAIHPSGQYPECPTRVKDEGAYDWALQSQIKVKLIGKAAKGIKAGVILADFKAG